MVAHRKRSISSTRGSGRRELLEGLESRLLMAAHVWTGAVDTLWGTDGNWVGGAPVTAEVDCDLEFPEGAARPANFNNIGNLDIRNITFSGKGASGNDYIITLQNGMSVTGVVTVNAGLTPALLSSSILMSSDVTFDVATTSLFTVTSTINGFQSLTKTGGGTLTLSPSFANNYHGQTNVDVGTLIITTGTAVGDGAVEVADGATLALGGAAGTRQVIQAITIAGTGVNGGGAIQLLTGVNGEFTNTLTIGGAATIATPTGRSLTVSGTLAGADDLTQVGAGTLTLSGGGAYSGTLTIAGALVVSSGLSSMNVAAPAGTVSGTGTVGTLTLTGGTVSPADADLDTLTVAGGVSFNATSTFAVGVAAPMISDRLDVTGTVTLGNATLSASLLVGSDPAIGAGYLLIDNDGVDAVVGTFAGLPEGAALSIGGKRFTITYAGGTGNDVMLTRTPLSIYVVGTDAGTVATIKVFNNDGTEHFAAFRPYGSLFRGGVTVATGDIDGDGEPEIITAPLAGTVPVVRIFSGETGVQISSFNPGYATLYRGGLYIAVGDVNGDGNADIIVAPKSGQSGLVKVFSGVDNSALGTPFKAYSATYGGGVRVAAGDVDGDGNADIITAPGNSTFKTIKVFSGLDYSIKLQEFTPYKSISNVPLGFGAGMFVAAGDFNGDGLADIATAPGSGGKGTVKLFNSADLATPLVLGTIPTPYTATWAYGVRLAVLDVSNDGTPDLLTMPGATGKSSLKIYDGNDLTFATLFNATPVRVFPAPYNGGGYVG